MVSSGYWGGVPDEVATALTAPGEAPEEQAPGLGHPRYQGTSIPAEFETRASVQDAPTRFALFGGMRRTSSAVRRSERALRAACKQAKPFVDANDATDQRSADGLAEQFGLGDWERTGRCRQTLREIVALALAAITDGAAFLAMEWAFEDGRWWIKRFHTRHVQTFTDVYQDQRGNFVGFKQQVDGRSAFVPLRSCLYIVDDDSQGIFGLGLNRTALPYQEDEQDALKKQRVAVHRFAFGTPVTGVRDLESYKELSAQAAQGGADMTANWMAENDTAQVNAVRGWMASKYGYIKREWWQQVEIVEANFEPAKLDETILARQRDIADIYEASWLYQGRSAVGSFGMVTAQAVAHLNLADESCEIVYAEINRQVCELWHAYNEPNIPRGNRAGLGYKLQRPRSEREVADYVALLQSGAATPGPDDERYFRTIYEWPDMPTEAESMGPAERGAALKRAATSQQGARAAARQSPTEILQQGRAAARAQGEVQ
jgi:hypothetical protein